MPRAQGPTTHLFRHSICSRVAHQRRGQHSPGVGRLERLASLKNARELVILLVTWHSISQFRRGKAVAIVKWLHVRRSMQHVHRGPPRGHFSLGRLEHAEGPGDASDRSAHIQEALEEPGPGEATCTRHSARWSRGIAMSEPHGRLRTACVGALQATLCRART